MEWGRAGEGRPHSTPFWCGSEHHERPFGPGCGGAERRQVRLVGRGDYEGLSALLSSPDGSDARVKFFGVIVPGPLVPELEMDE